MRPAVRDLPCGAAAHIAAWCEQHGLPLLPWQRHLLEGMERPTVTVFDPMWRPLGQLGDDLTNNPDPNPEIGRLVLEVRDGRWTSVFAECGHRMVPVVVRKQGTATAYYVKTFTQQCYHRIWSGSVELVQIGWRL